MAETTTTSNITNTSLKRLRDEEDQNPSLEEEIKRHKPSSYNQILSFLEEDEEEPTQDLSSLITSLQQELSSSETRSESLSLPKTGAQSETKGVEDEVIRHLLEASDDELGIPSGDETAVDVAGGAAGEDYGFNGGDYLEEFSLCDGLWELEDETANYYTLLQSELFM